MMRPVEAGSADTRRWTLIAVCATTFMLLVDITIVNVALPSIQRHLDADCHALLMGLVASTSSSTATTRRGA